MRAAPTFESARGERLDEVGERRAVFALLLTCVRVCLDFLSRNRSMCTNMRILPPTNRTQPLLADVTKDQGSLPRSHDPVRNLHKFLC